MRGASKTEALAKAAGPRAGHADGQVNDPADVGQADDERTHFVAITLRSRC